MERIPVTILTGFLGSGKTTLLNRLISEPGFERTAVIVNEFGEAGVDGALVAQGDERAFAMSTGCLCCTVSGDVRLTLLRLLDEARKGVGPTFDRVVIETTGIADPLPVLQTFMTNDIVLSRFALNGVVTLVDAVNGSDAMERFEEARRQIAVADLVLVTKRDLADGARARWNLERLESQLRREAPTAEVLPVEEATAAMAFSRAAFDPSGRPPDVLEWLRFDPDASHGHDHHHHHGHAHCHEHDVNQHGDAASAFCFSASGPIDPWDLEDAVTALRSTYGRDLLRMKGVIETTEDPSSPRVVHVVGHIASPMRRLDGWPDGLNGTRLVMIVAGERREEAVASLMQLLPELVGYVPVVGGSSSAGGARLLLGAGGGD